MATHENLVRAVTRAVVRTAAGCVTGLVLGALVMGLAVGPGLWHDVASGRQGLSTAWELGGREKSGEPPPSVQAEHVERRVSRLSERLDCRREGFGHDVIPASALVQVRGDVRSVPFDEGWAVHRGERPGRLLAVCRA